MANNPPAHWILNDIVLNGSEAVGTRVRALLQRRGQAVAPPTYVEPADEFVDTPDGLSSLLLTTINGDRHLQPQKLQVEYLKPNQLLAIPYFLAMNPLNEGVTIVPRVGNACTRYRKIAKMAFVEVRSLFKASSGTAELRALIDGLPEPNAADTIADYYSGTYYIDANGRPYDQTEVSIVFTAVSQSLKLNCDIRDFGALLRADMRMADSSWAWEINNLAASPITRLNSKLFAYTLQSIAALNLSACSGKELGAWVRAFGVSSGVLPDKDSQTIPEYSFVSGLPKVDALRGVRNFQAGFEFNLRSVCMNLIAMFGLMHLNTDHTYRTGDSSMERIGLSYLRTLRTAVSADVMSTIEGDLEVNCWTAAHPFGLGQTYTVAKLMHIHEVLTPALSIRHKVCPPGVQRFMIARAAHKEWGALTAGAALSEVFSNEIAEVDAQCAKIEQNPPAYSSQHRLYGVANQTQPDEKAVEAVVAIMPVCVAYAESQHVSSDNRRDGMDLALSINNAMWDI